MRDLIVRTLGHYRIVEKIGEAASRNQKFPTGFDLEVGPFLWRSGVPEW